MALPKLYAHIELSDGAVHENLRSFAQDRIRYSETAPKNGWALDDEQRLQSFIAWTAAKRAGVYSGTYDKFVGGEAVEWVVTDGRNDEDESDPTVTTS